MEIAGLITRFLASGPFQSAFSEGKSRRVQHPCVYLALNSIATVLLAAILLLLLAAPAQAQPLRVTDDRGVTLVLPKEPRRIISLMPALTEIVCELGSCDFLVGIDNYSNWPVPVRYLPRLGGIDDANVEKIVALRPDLVLLPGSSRAVARLERLGVKVAALEPRSLAELHRTLLQVGNALGASGAPALWERIQAGVDAAARAMPPELRGTTVYFEVGAGPYAASESSFIGEVFTRIGAGNIVPGSLGPFPKLNPEFVLRADPQVILVSERYLQALKLRPGWARIRALRDNRICVVTPEQGDILVRPGPRVAEAAQLMVQCLQGRLKGRAP
jgi:iron complex transport system substrate-binding protein